MLEQSFSGSNGADRPEVFQSESETEASFVAGAKIELTHFETQAVAVEIIANLRSRPLEK
jgi:hypothetical protein